MPRFVAKEDFPHGTSDYNYLAYSHSFTEGIGFDVHWHDEWEIIYVRDGRYIFYVDGKGFTVRKGEALLIDHYAIHFSGGFDLGDGSGYNCFVFGTRFLCPDKESYIYRRYFRQLESGRLNLTQMITGEKEYEKEILRLCRKLDAYSSPDDAMSIQIALLSIFDILVAQKAYTAMRHQESIQNELIKTALLYINQAYQTPFQLADLSSELHMSTDHFIRLFKNLLGITPKRYILQMRLRHAQALIKNDPTLPIADISSLAGFMDNNYFSRIFKKEMGMTPSQFRLICQKTNPQTTDGEQHHDADGEKRAAFDAKHPNCLQDDGRRG